MKCNGSFGKRAVRKYVRVAKSCTLLDNHCIATEDDAIVRKLTAKMTDKVDRAKVLVIVSK